MFSFLQAIIRETIHICCIFCWNLLIFKFIIWTNFVYEASVLVLLKILFSIKILFSAEGIIITGGGGGSAGITSVEEVILSNSTLCTLPPLPEGRYRHSQSGLTACGGQDSTAQDTCTTFSNGAWTTSHNLNPFRKQENIMSVGTPLAASCCLEESPVCRQQVFCPQQHPPSATSLNCSITRSMYV